jgi:type III secretion inner rod protein HrpB2
MTVPISAITPPVSLPSVNSVGGPADATPATFGNHAPDGLGARFREALEQARLVPEQSGHIQGPSTLSQAVTTQDATYNALTDRINAFEAQSGHMSIQEVAAQTMAIQHAVTDEMVKIYTGTAVAQGGKGTVQTLMKNQ